ncbi:MULTISPECIES: Na/Pi symporter [Bacillus]|uniref:Na/Pi symporter n=1 Tax=Bacillus TaxID=1386 RepID=UPI0002E5E446|nr:MULTISPECIES: Na/Pi symporter [Bacillus]
MREVILFTLYIIVFLVAIALLRNGLFNLTGEKLKSRLHSLTSTPIKGFFTGMIFTALLQSSSAVMVMTVGLVSVGGITFQQSIGIILGSNIGTTVTAEFLSFSTDTYVIPGLIIGFLLMLIPKSSIRYLGFSIFGLFMIFYAINGFTSLAEPFSQYRYFTATVQSIENHLILAVIVGALFAGTIHSGTATIAIAMGFIMGGQLTVDSGIAIMLGSNIGTCITGYIASLGAGKEAKLTAYAHIWLNVLGVLLFFPFIHQLQEAAAFFTDEKHVQLAHASVIFNVICSLLVLPFVNVFSKFLLTIHNRT